ncbi:MAG: REP-associated tyrosine transposase [Planctomycetota bacterium]|jgi:REP element-mobilizing transposase RayT
MSTQSNNMEKGYFERKKPARGVHYDPERPTIVFVTVCTKNRDPWLANAEVHDILLEMWKDASAWQVGRYTIMPDHVHLFAGYTGSEISLENWVRYWKAKFTKRYKQMGKDWQSGFWDRRIRRGESYEEKWKYMQNNPVRHGLVDKPGDWIFQGEMHPLSW